MIKKEEKTENNSGGRIKQFRVAFGHLDDDQNEGGETEEEALLISQGQNSKNIFKTPQNFHSRQPPSEILDQSQSILSKGNLDEKSPDLEIIAQNGGDTKRDTDQSAVSS